MMRDRPKLRQLFDRIYAQESGRRRPGGNDYRVSCGKYFTYCTR